MKAPVIIPAIARPPMIEPKPLPTRQIRRLASLARWSLGLVLGLWLLLASVWGVLHFWIVPRIGEWRPELEALASRSLGIPVSIGKLAAYRSGLVPTFELGDVVLKDPASQSEALRLLKVVVAVSAHSLLTLGVDWLPGILSSFMTVFMCRFQMVARRLKKTCVASRGPGWPSAVQLICGQCR